MKIRKVVQIFALVVSFVIGPVTSVVEPRELWDFLRALTPAWATVIGGLIGGSLVGLSALLAFKASMNTRETMEETRKTAERTADMTRRTMERTAEMTHQREVMAVAHGRYTTIAEQLSSTHQMVRLAGVYALAALADEWQKVGEIGQRDVAVRLLCAYLRSNQYANDNKGKLDQGRIAEHGDSEVRKAVVHTIRTHTIATAEHKWPGSLIDLSGADLEDVNLWHADLSGAVLSQANLRGANLGKANLFQARLWSANLQGAHLSNANLSKSHLWDANLKWANLSKANMTGVELWDTDFTEANFTGASLNGVDLSGANLSGAKGISRD